MIQTELERSHAEPSDAELQWLAKRLVDSSRGSTGCDAASLPPADAPARFPRRPEPVRTSENQAFYDSYWNAANAGNDAEALRVATRWVTTGDREAFEEMAVIHAGGYGVPKNAAEAIRWHDKAIAAGSGWSATAAGLINLEGAPGVPQNVPKAIDYLLKALELRGSGGYYNVGVLFERGHGGLPINKPLGAALIVRAAEREYPNALRTAAEMFFNGRNVPKDTAKALAFTRTLADQEEDPAAMNQLAICYAGQCDGSAVDWRQAESWYLKAIAKKHPNAMFNLGLLYQMDTPLFDLQKSLRYYREAQAAGMREAQAEIAHITEFLNRPAAPAQSMDQQTVNRAWSGYGQSQPRQQVCTNDYTGGRYQRICRDARPGELTVPSYW